MSQTEQAYLARWGCSYLVGTSTLVFSSCFCLPREITLLFYFQAVCPQNCLGTKQYQVAFTAITELFRIKHGNRGIFYDMASSVVDQFFPKKRKPHFFRTKLIWVGLGLGLGLGLELVSKVVSWAFFDISLLIKLEPHVSHTKFADFYTISYIIIHWRGKGFSRIYTRQQKALRSAPARYRYARSQHKEEWKGMADVADGPTFEVQTDDLQMPRAPCSRLTTRTPHASVRNTYELVPARAGTFRLQGFAP